MRTDGQGNLYVMTQEAPRTVHIYVYAMSSGTLTLKRSFNSALPDFLGTGMTVDKTGVVYIDLYNNPEILSFSATASGNVSPSATYGISQLLRNLAEDSSGNIYGLGENGFNIYEFSAGMASLTPINIFTPASPGSEDLTVANDGNLYMIASPPAIISFAVGRTTPTETMIGSNTGLQSQNALAADSKNQLWICSETQTTATVLKFPSLPNGNLAPLSQFTIQSAVSGGTDTIVVY